MNNSQFHQLADALFFELEEYLDSYTEKEDKDIDYDIFGSVMNIHFANGSKIVINRQEPLQEIWVATQENGYHFAYREKHWICTRSGEEFREFVRRAIQKQAQ